MNDLLGDFVGDQQPQPDQFAQNGAAGHHHRSVSTPDIVTQTQTKPRRWSQASGLPEGPSGATVRRTNSDKVPKKSGASGFLAKYRARKSRDSKDLSDSTLPPGVPPPVTNGYAANGVNEQGEQMVYLTPEGVQQLIADSMAPFLEDTSQIKALLADIKSQQAHVEALHDRCKVLTTSHELKEGRARCKEAIEKVTRTVKQVKDRLNALDELNTEILTAAKYAGCMELREVQMRVTVMAGLSAKLQDQCATWGALRAKWADEEKEEVGRQLYTVTGHQYTEDELQEVVDSGGQDRIYQQALMAPGTKRDVKAMLTQIEQRHSEMQELEKSMLDLYQVFLDMSVVVAEQGEMLDRIEGWVLNAKEQMSAGLEQLIEAKAFRRKAAQKKAITFVTGVALVGVGAGVSATGAGAVIGIPVAIAGAAIAGAAAAM